MAKKYVFVALAAMIIMVAAGVVQALPQEVKKQKAKTGTKKIAPVRTMARILPVVSTDPDEAAVPNTKDFHKLGLQIVGGNILTDIIFYDNVRLTEFHYYFSTDADSEAEILVRCRSSSFEVLKASGSGAFSTLVYSGTPTVSGKKYSLNLPWGTVIGDDVNVNLWFYSSESRDRMPNSGSVRLYWWTYNTCSRHEETDYEGTRDYKRVPLGWWMRCDGTIDPRRDTFFPNLNVRNSEVNSMLSSIGCPSGPASSDTEIWNRIVTVVHWLQANCLSESDPNYERARSYVISLPGKPSLVQIAYIYSHYGGVYWTTGMGRAQPLATLLYAVGIPKDRFCIAESKWKPEYSQYFFVIVYVNNKWIFLDPSPTSHISAGTVRAVGHSYADYYHPHKIFPIPGANIRGVPLVER